MDSIIESKVKFGRAQIIPLLYLLLVDMNDGAQLVLSSFLTPVVQHQWNLSSFQASILTSIFYMGTFLGSIISGKLSDTYGRKVIITIGSTLQLIFTCCFLFVSSFESMLVVRFLYGFSFGFTIVITTSTFAQMSSMAYRGKGLLLLNFGVSLGKIYGVFLAYICLLNFHEGNWKLMMFLSALPNIIVLYGCKTSLKQSFRFLIAHGRFEEGYTIIQEMTRINNPQQINYKLTPEQKQIIEQWHQEVFQMQEKATYRSLFNPQYLRTTVCLSICWFSINFSYFGQLIALPFIYGKQQKSFLSYALTIAGEMPSFLVSIYFVDKPNFGRKNSLIYCFSISAIFNAIFIFSPITLFSSLTRFFMKEVFQMIYPFTTESFGTLNRTLGFGLCAAIGRLGSSIMPYLIVPLTDVNISLIFWIFVFWCTAGAISGYMVPKQSLNKSLDEKCDHSSNKLIPLQQKQVK